VDWLLADVDAQDGVGEQEPALRRQALAIGMQLLSEAPGAIYLYQPVRIHALQKGVADFKAFPNLLFDLDRVGR